ncbi:MAG: hypothetical protein ACIAQZ_12290 [Sedimentisphaeraceae bacterium JB056]
MIEALQLSKQLAESLSGSNFSQPFNASAKVLPEYELSALKNLTVTIVPKSVEIINLTRAASNFQIEIDVAVQKKITTKIDTDVESLLTLVSEIVDFVNRRNIGEARFIKVSNDPIYSTEHLNEKRLFTSLITVTYLTMKAN